MTLPPRRRITVAPGVEDSVVVWRDAHEATAEAPFLLVHGLASNLRLWDGVARRLAAAGHAVAAIDQRGHGHSDKPDDGYDYATVTADLVAASTALGLDRPIVVGQSWGGNVVLELGWRHPDAVRAVAAVDGGVIALARVFASWEEVATVLRPPPLVGTPVEQMRARMASYLDGFDDEAVDAQMANLEIRDDGTVAPWLTLDRHLAILREMWETDPAATYERIAVPVLLMPVEGGLGGEQRGEAVAAALERIPRARAHWFADAHHDVHLQRPDEVADLLLAAVADGFLDPEVAAGR